MNTNLPTKQTIAFPEVGVIRKGLPKMKTIKGDREVWSFGKDLNQNFRISFLPGTDATKQVWHQLHEKQYKVYGPNFSTNDGYELPVISAMIPFKNAFDAWTWASETYDASGRMIGKAVNGFYVTKRDPMTGAFIVKDGQPETPYFPGDFIQYKRGDRVYQLVLKPSGRLRLFIPEVARFVNFTLKTSSYYDAIRIQENLGAIQMVADMLNNGIAGGIPFFLYRVSEQISYTKSDGTAGHVNKWICRLEADPDWVQSAVARMGQFALTGSQVVGLLKPAEKIEEAPVPEFLKFTPAEKDIVEGVIQDVDTEPEDFTTPDDTEPEVKVDTKALPREKVENKGKTMFAFDHPNIVKICAGLWNIDEKHAKEQLTKARDQHTINEKMTLDEAIGFAKANG